MSLLSVLSFAFYGVAGLLLLEVLVFRLPGAEWNGARRGLFRVLYPLLSWANRFLLGDKLRGLLLALVLIGVGYVVGHWAQITNHNV
jgi:hypothetical protein